MEDKEILNVVLKYRSGWTEDEIGTFIRRAVIEDISEEDLVKDIGAERIWREQ